MGQLEMTMRSINEHIYGDIYRWEFKYGDFFLVKVGIQVKVTHSDFEDGDYAPALLRYQSQECIGDFTYKINIYYIFNIKIKKYNSNLLTLLYSYIFVIIYYGILMID